MRTFTVLCIALVAATTGCKGKLSKDKLVSMIRDDLFGAKNIKTKSVNCPDRDLKAGDKYTCDVTLESGEAVTINVEADADGNVSVKTQGEVIDPAKVAAEIGPKIGMPATSTTTCDHLIAPKGPFTCELIAGDRKHKVEITPTATGVTFKDLSAPAAPDHGDAKPDDTKHDADHDENHDKPE